MSHTRTLGLGGNGVARLAADLGDRQAALDRYRRDGHGAYQARTLIESMRTMVRTLKVVVPFRTGSHALESHLRAELAELAAALRDIPAVGICIEGHTDVRGARRFNRKLAFERVHAVRDVFIAHGIARTRLTARALGAEGAMYPHGDRGGYPFDRQAIITFDVREVNP